MKELPFAENVLQDLPLEERRLRIRDVVKAVDHL
jgi:hypothetical protein